MSTVLMSQNAMYDFGENFIKVKVLCLLHYYFCSSAGFEIWDCFDKKKKENKKNHNTEWL